MKPQNPISFRYITRALLTLICISAIAFRAPAQVKKLSKADSMAIAYADSLKKAANIADKNLPAAQCTGNNPVFTGDVIGIGCVCLIVCGLLIYFAVKSPKSENEALGLPAGSVRAIIAILSVVFYVLLAVGFGVFACTSSSPICTDVIKTLGVLVVAISSFYFGSKTAEQSGTAAVKNAIALQQRAPGPNE